MYRYRENFVYSLNNLSTVFEYLLYFCLTFVFNSPSSTYREHCDNQKLIKWLNMDYVSHKVGYELNGYFLKRFAFKKLKPLKVLRDVC